jgi:hypothetical protein
LVKAVFRRAVGIVVQAARLHSFRVAMAVQASRLHYDA